MKRKPNSKRNTITLSISYPVELRTLIEKRCRDQSRSRSNYINALILDDLDREAMAQKKNGS